MQSFNKYHLWVINMFSVILTHFYLSAVLLKYYVPLCTISIRFWMLKTFFMEQGKVLNILFIWNSFILHIMLFVVFLLGLMHMTVCILAHNTTWYMELYYARYIKSHNNMWSAVSWTELPLHRLMYDISYKTAVCAL